MTQHISVYSQHISVYSQHISVYSQHISVYSQHISVYSQYIIYGLNMMNVACFSIYLESFPYFQE